MMSNTAFKNEEQRCGRAAREQEGNSRTPVLVFRPVAAQLRWWRKVSKACCVAFGH